MCLQGNDPFIDVSGNNRTINNNGSVTTSSDTPTVKADTTDMNGGMVWTKARTSSSSFFAIKDTETDQDNDITLYTAGTFAGTTYRAGIDFNKDGYSLRAPYVDDEHNYFVDDTFTDYVSWSFRKAPRFFDCVTYTGAVTAQNISLNLGSDVGMILVKRIDSTASWNVYHRGLNGGTNPDWVEPGTGNIDFIGIPSGSFLYLGGAVNQSTGQIETGSGAITGQFSGSVDNILYFNRNLEKSELNTLRDYLLG